MYRQLLILSLSALVCMVGVGARAATLVEETNSTDGLHETLNYRLYSSTGALGVEISGFNVESFDYAHGIQLLDPWGQNLLSSWDYTPASSGALAIEYNDGSAVPALAFGGYAPGFYDAFSQTVIVDAGAVYTLKITHESFGGGLNGFRVVTDAELAPAAVPESDTWIQLMAGFGIAGLALRKRSNRRVVVC